MATGGGRIKAVLHRSDEGEVLPHHRAKGAASILRSRECDEDHSLITAALLGGHDQRPRDAALLRPSAFPSQAAEDLYACLTVWVNAFVRSP